MGIGDIRVGDRVRHRDHGDEGVVMQLGSTELIDGDQIIGVDWDERVVGVCLLSRLEVITTRNILWE